LAEVVPGMILSRPVKLGGDTVLVQQDVVLNDRIIQLLESRGIKQVYVKDAPSSGETGEADDELRQLIVAREVERFGDMIDNPLQAAVLEAVIDLKCARGEPPPTVRRADPPPPPRARTAEEIHQRAKKVRSLPTLPAIYEKVQKVTQDPDASASDVAKVVEWDPVFAAALLRIANSALYSRTEPVTTVLRAVSLLGDREIRDLCLLTSVLKNLKLAGGAAPSVTRFWLHAVAAGSAAKVLGQKLGGIPREELFLSGLLHDVGKVFWLRYCPADLVDVYAAAESSGQPFWRAERKRLGTTHMRLGRLIGQHWRLPGQYIEVIAEHHAPGQATGWQLLCRAVHVADFLVHALELDGPSLLRLPVLEPTVWQALGWEVDELPYLLDLIQEEFAENRKSFVFPTEDGAEAPQVIGSEA
jgi:HD-like signal output (HDOD) protein